MFGSSEIRGELNGFLDAGSHISGELRFEDTFRIEGKLTGSVVSNGELVVGERGDVEGDIRARHIYVAGTVRGSLRATERVEITATGKVLADLFTPVLKMEEGAILEGNCKMQKSSLSEDAKSTPAQVKATAQGRGGEDRDKVARLTVAKS